MISDKSIVHISSNSALLFKMRVALGCFRTSLRQVFPVAFVYLLSVLLAASLSLAERPSSVKESITSSGAESITTGLRASNLSRQAGLSRSRGIQSLPRPDASKPFLKIDKSNLNDFKPYLIRPISDWIERSWLSLSASGSTEFAWSLGFNWNRLSSKNLGKVDLEGSSLVPSEGNSNNQSLSLEGGYPFGSSKNISAVSSPEEKAQRIIWNSYAAQSSVRDQFYDFTLDWVGFQSSFRSARALFYRRSFPFEVARGISAETPSRAEFLSFYSPSVILGYSTTLATFLGKTEDSYWHFSPVVARKRRLLDANRSDPLINSKLAWDDFFVWSGKPESFDAQLLDDKLMLMPVASLKLFEAQLTEMTWQELALSASERDSSEPADSFSLGGQKGEQVLRVSGLTDKSSLMDWGFQEDARSALAAWRPSGGRFVLRDVWVVGLYPRDPNYLSGKQVVFFDKESFLPLAKLSYDHSGDLSKVVLGFWGFAEAGKNERVFPVLAGLLSAEPESQSATVWRTQTLSLFRAKGSELLPKIRQGLDIDFHLRLNGVDPEPKLPGAEDLDEKNAKEAPERESNLGRSSGLERPGLPPAVGSSSLKPAASNVPSRSLTPKKPLPRRERQLEASDQF